MSAKPLEFISLCRSSTARKQLADQALQPVASPAEEHFFASAINAIHRSSAGHPEARRILQN
jgi:hypothetical protein